jgi:hypothetical protein
LAFAATTAVPQLLSDGKSRYSGAMPAFSDISAPDETRAQAARDIYTVQSKGGELVVYDEFGKVIDTYEMLPNLPAEDKTALRQGITVFGTEALLSLLEDYGE